MWWHEHVAIKDEWAECTCDIKPRWNDDDAVLIFSGLAAQAGEFWFASVSMTVRE